MRNFIRKRLIKQCIELEVRNDVRIYGSKWVVDHYDEIVKRIENLTIEQLRCLKNYNKIINKIFK